MPLIKCPDCGTLLSDSAKMCMNCNYPLSENLLNCPECNTKSFKSMLSCPSCGYPFSKIVDSGVELVPQDVDITQKTNDIVQGIQTASALSKSYVGSAFLVFFLYFVFYLPGLILNVIWLREANASKKQSGVSPSGIGCLTILYFAFFVIPLVGGLILFFLTLAGVSSIF